MGAWGFNILENDSSADAYAEYVDAMNAGLSPAEAIAKIRTEFADVLADDEDAAYVWLGVAKAQWEYGHIDRKMIERVESIATSDAHLAEWDDAGPRGCKKWRKVIETFAAKLGSSNPRPKKPRKAKLRKPVYEPGTCLSIALDGGRFAAGLVTFNVIEDPGPGQDTFGINSVALLDYLAKAPPSIDVFERRQYVREEADAAVRPWIPVVRSCFANFHRRAKEKLTVVGTVKLKRADALVPSSGCLWDFKDAEKLIKRWRENRGRRGLLLADRLEDVPAWRKIMRETDKILRKRNPDRPPPKTLEQQIDLSSLQQ